MYKRFEGKETYNFATNSDEKPNTNTVHAFLCAQTNYINSLKTYNDVNAATKFAVEHLILTQVGMKQGIKIWVRRASKP